MKLTFTVVLAVLLLVSAAPVATAGGSKGDVYPLATCPVSGNKLGEMGKPVTIRVQGREIRLCCKGCAKPFRKDSATYLKKIDAEIVKEQMSFYPLDTCLVSGEKLGAKAVDHVYRNRLVRLSDPACIAAFDKDADAMLAKLDAAVIAKQKASYPLDTCVVSGGKLGGMGTVVEFVYANRLVRFCCAGCVPTFEKNPRALLAKIDAAAKKSGATSSDATGASCGCGKSDADCGGCGKKDADGGGGCGGGGTGDSGGGSGGG